MSHLYPFQNISIGQALSQWYFFSDPEAVNGSVLKLNSYTLRCLFMINCMIKISCIFEGLYLLKTHCTTAWVVVASRYNFSSLLAHWQTLVFEWSFDNIIWRSEKKHNLPSISHSSYHSIRIGFLTPYGVLMNIGPSLGFMSIGTRS